MPNNLALTLEAYGSNQMVQDYLSTNYPCCNYIPWNEPIPRTVHALDVNISGTMMRLRFFSPSHEGDQQTIAYSVLTPAQVQKEAQDDAQHKADKQAIITKYNASRRG